MKWSSPLTVSLFAAVCLACRYDGLEQKSVRNEASPSPNASEVVRTGNGTIIKKTGWQLPVALPEEKRYHATTVIIDGRKVEVLNSPFLPKELLVMRFPKLTEDGEDEYLVSQILELTDRRKRPYCYQFFASTQPPDAGPYKTTFFSYRDDDGDGVFETLAREVCSVPEWVKETSGS